MRSTIKIRLQKITVNKYNKYNPKKGTRKWCVATGKKYEEELLAKLANKVHHPLKTH